MLQVVEYVREATAYARDMRRETAIIVAQVARVRADAESQYPEEEESGWALVPLLSDKSAEGETIKKTNKEETQ